LEGNWPNIDAKEVCMKTVGINGQFVLLKIDRKE
jgi:hypothetical protein